MVTNSDIADLLDIATGDLLSGIGVEAPSAWWINHSQQCMFTTVLSHDVSVYRHEMNKSSVSRFLMLLKVRFFTPIEDTYLRMVERWGMSPRYVIEEPKCADYYEGFVA